MNKNIAIVLVEPEYGGNIGSAVRAMKNMGLRDLRLVNPVKPWRRQADIMAVFAKDLLDKARTCDSVAEAIADTHLVVGTTRRVGAHRGAFLEFDDAVERLNKASARKKTAVLFGKESKGLSNEDLGLCDWMVRLPSDEAHPSINLAQAVMMMSFSLFRARSQKKHVKTEFNHLSKKEVAVALDRFDEAIHSLAYKPVVAERIHVTFRNMIKRSGLLKSEGEMLKGISRRIVVRFPDKLRERKR